MEKKHPIIKVCFFPSVSGFQDLSPQYLFFLFFFFFWHVTHPAHHFVYWIANLDCFPYELHSPSWNLRAIRGDSSFQCDSGGVTLETKTTEPNILDKTRCELLYFVAPVGGLVPAT